MVANSSLQSYRLEGSKPAWATNDTVSKKGTEGYRGTVYLVKYLLCQRKNLSLEPT